MTHPSRVVLATDHAGFSLKEAVKKHLAEKGIDVIDVGTFSDEQVDYPEIMRKGAAVVLEYECPGIFFGKSGNGEAMAANKVRGIRAAVCYNEEITKLAREHNDANVMSIGAGFLKEADAFRLIDIFLTTEFVGGRHVARIADLEIPLL